MSNFKNGWYIIYTRPRYEKRVQERLNQSNIECFLPQHRVLKIWHDRKKYINQPLFPSYIFVFLKDLKEYYYGFDVDGSLGYVKIGKEVAKVRESIISSIKMIQNSGLEIVVTDFCFSSGQKLKVPSGALSGMECEFVNYKNKKMGLIRVLQHNILISLPLGCLSTV